MLKINQEYLFNITFVNNNKLCGYTCKINICAENTYEISFSKKSINEELQDFIQNQILLIDNAFVYNKNTNNQFEKDLINLLKSNNQKLYGIENDFSLINLTKHIFKKLNFDCVMENKDFRIESINLQLNPHESIIIKEN